MSVQMIPFGFNYLCIACYFYCLPLLNLPPVQSDRTVGDHRIRYLCFLGIAKVDRYVRTTFIIPQSYQNCTLACSPAPLYAFPYIIYTAKCIPIAALHTLYSRQKSIHCQ